MRPVAETDPPDRDGFEAIMRTCRPVVMRGLARRWPAVEAGRTPGAFRDYLKAFDNGGRMEAFFGPPAIAGKYYYSDDFSGFNFERRTMTLAAALDIIVENAGREGAPSTYVGSVPVDNNLPGFSHDNPMSLIDGIAARIWIGHASNVSTHYDAFDNIAVVAAGRRRFTLYAPELTGKLYIGPIDRTMAGQPVSLAASSPPDDDKYPLFAAIRDEGLVADLEPGDALYLPKLWWHGVEATAPFNVLVNYWWDGFAIGPDAPYTTLLLAMIAIAERPPAERAAWKAYFDHYVFRSEGHPLRHLPAELHGMLGPLRPDNYGRIRAFVMRMLRGGN